MYFGVFPFFMFGFLLTVFPRWLRAPAAEPASYTIAWLVMSSGWLVVYGALLFNSAWMAIGLSLCLFGWGSVWWELLRIYRARSVSTSGYEIILLAAVGLGALMLFVVTVGFVRQIYAWIGLALQGALWLFLLPIAFTVSHRMIPFFSGIVIKDYEIYQPRWLLLAGLGMMLGHAAATVLAWPVTWLFDLVLALIVARLGLAWGLLKSLSIRLLAMLHIAFGWLALGALLSALQGLALQLSGTYLLGRAPLHAIGIGFLASLLIAFASRVSLGHSGRGLVANPLTWYCFVGFQGVAILRVLADLPWSGMAWSAPLYMAAAVLWLAAGVAWSSFYLPIYWRPRADGQPG
jgi:uncharacterized protein involved in response to NO